eukprot:229053_1
MELYSNGHRIPLTRYQIQQIQDLILNPTASQVISRKDTTHEDMIQVEYKFDVANTFLHSARIQHISQHYVLIICIFIFGVLWLILNNIFRHNVFFHVYGIAYFALIYIPWLISQHFFFNKAAYKLCINSFDFWIKINYGFLLNAALLFFAIFDCVYTRTDILYTDVLYLTMRVLVTICIILNISYIATLDAVHCNKLKKLIICVGTALICTILSIKNQFLLADEQDYKIHLQLPYGVRTISIFSLIASSSRILAIFFWKQSYKTWSNKGRAIAIVNSPKIIWIDSNETTLQKEQDEKSNPDANNVQMSEIREANATGRIYDTDESAISTQYRDSNSSSTAL